MDSCSPKDIEREKLSHRVKDVCKSYIWQKPYMLNK